MFGLTNREAQIIMAGPQGLSRAWDILQYVAKKPRGATCDDCTGALGLTHQTCSPRFSDLERAGCLVPTGKVRKTQSGSSARVMVVSPTADFRAFMVITRRKGAQSRTVREAALAALCEDFIAKWKKRTSREEALRTFVAKALKIDSSHPLGVK